MKSMRLLFRIIALGVVVGAAGLVWINVLDYQRFHRAIQRMENLTEEQFRALGDAADRVEDHIRTDQPKGFEILQPISASLYPGSSDILLYELKLPVNHPGYEEEHIYLYLRIDTAPSNQQILYFTNSWGKQRTKVLWNRNLEFVRKHSPRDRILTITQWGRDRRTWIVLQDRLLVVDERSYVGGEPKIMADVALDAAGMGKIKQALANLPAGMRGKDYRADNVMDGIGLEIVFNSDGERDSPDTITISNTWVEEFRPLLMALYELSPADYPIKFIEYMTTHDHLMTYPMTVRTQAEWDKIYYGKPRMPWWCIWRRWLD